MAVELTHAAIEIHVTRALQLNFVALCLVAKTIAAAWVLSVIVSMRCCLLGMNALLLLVSTASFVHLFVFYAALV
jgi:hypothetical protein